MRDSKILVFEPVIDTRTPTPPSDIQDEHLDKLLQLMLANSQDPIGDLSGYLITEDPTYLPDHLETKALIRHIGRDKLLQLMLSRLLSMQKSNSGEGES